MGVKLNQEEFSSSVDTICSVCVIPGSGTVELQAAFIDPDGTKDWIALPNGSSALKTTYNLEMAAGQIYRFDMTGDAKAYVSI